MTIQRYDWVTIRAEYEVGASMRSLARKHGCSQPAISKRAKKDLWTQDCEPAVKRLVTEMVITGGEVISPDNKKNEAIKAEAQRRAAVLIRHKKEWDEHLLLISQAVSDRDFDLAKLAKITSETIRIRQDGERKAWRLDDMSDTGNAIICIRVPQKYESESEWVKSNK